MSYQLSALSCLLKARLILLLINVKSGTKYTYLSTHQSGIETIVILTLSIELSIVNFQLSIINYQLYLTCAFTTAKNKETAPCLRLIAVAVY